MTEAMPLPSAPRGVYDGFTVAHRGYAVHAVNTLEQDPRSGVTLLVAVTALFFAVSTPQVVEAPAGNALAGGPQAIVERVMEWRPQSPPPWGDMDQAASDDVEPAAGPAAEGGPRDRASSDSLRSRSPR